VVVSANWTGIFGVGDNADVTFDTWRNALHPEDRDRTVNALMAAIEQRHLWASAPEYNVDYRVVWPDGTVRWVVDRGRASYDETGRPISMAGVNVDVTERKRVEEALRESEERFRLLVDGVKDHAVFMLDPDGRVVSWNRGAQSIKGYTTPEIIGRHISCFYVPEDVEQGKPERLLKAAAEHGQVEDEGWRVRKDSSLFWAEVAVSALWDDSGHLRGFGNITRDITVRKRVEERIAHLASFPELNPTPIFETDLEDKITYANPAAQRQFSGLVKTGTEHTLLRDWASVLAVFKTNTEQTIVREVESDGAAFLQTIHYVPELGLLRAYLVNITEKKLAEQQMRALEGQLRQAQKMEAVGRLAGGIAHDFNNLLMVISSYTEMLEGRLPAEDNLRRNTQQVMKAANRAASLTGQLLAFSRKQVLSPRVLDLNAVVNETAKMLKRLIGEDIELLVSLAELLWWLEPTPIRSFRS
jgi:PAS domain S-box-containing protein